MDLDQAQAGPLTLDAIRLDDLSDGPGILPFKLGSTKIISHDHTFLQEIDIDMISRQIDILQVQLTDLSNKLSNKNYSIFRHQILHLFNKLNKTALELETFEPRRAKRGLFNPLGSFIKSISGNLDNEDALRFENALNILQNNDQDISLKFNKHISLYKEMTLQQTQILNNLTSNQGKLYKAINLISSTVLSDKDLILQFSQISQLFSIVSENVQELSFEINRISNIIAFSRTNVMHHSILSVGNLRSMLSKLKELYNPSSLLNLDIRFYYDLISLGSYFIDKKIVIVLKFPIMSLQSYDLYKLCPVPNKKSEVILPPFPYMASNSQEFAYMEAECPKIDTWYICKQQLGHQIRTHSDCVFNLIYHQHTADCHPTSISLLKEALLELDSQHYVLSLPSEIRIKSSCRQENYEILKGSYLATIPRNCSIRTPEFTIVNSDDKSRGQPVEIMTFPESIPMSADSKKQLPHYNFTTTDLNKLHNIQHQVLMDPPVDINSENLSSLYHTTIPTYVIVLLSALALFSLAYYMKRQLNRKQIVSLQSQEIEMASAVSTASTADKKAATFALNLRK